MGGAKYQGKEKGMVTTASRGPTPQPRDLSKENTLTIAEMEYIDAKTRELTEVSGIEAGEGGGLVVTTRHSKLSHLDAIEKLEAFNPGLKEQYLQLPRKYKPTEVVGEECDSYDMAIQAPGFEQAGKDDDFLQRFRESGIDFHVASDAASKN